MGAVTEDKANKVMKSRNYCLEFEVECYKSPCGSRPDCILMMQTTTIMGVFYVNTERICVMER